MIISFRGRMYRMIPLVIIVLTLLFCFLLIVNACYKYHLETEERRLLLNTVKCKDCRTLVDKKTVIEEVKTVEEVKPVIEIEKNHIENCLKLKDSNDFILIPEEFKHTMEFFKQNISEMFGKENGTLKRMEQWNETIHIFGNKIECSFFNKKDNRQKIYVLFIKKDGGIYIDRIKISDVDNTRKIIKDISISENTKYITIKVPSYEY